MPRDLHAVGLGIGGGKTWLQIHWSGQPLAAEGASGLGKQSCEWPMMLSVGKTKVSKLDGVFSVYSCDDYEIRSSCGESFLSDRRQAILMQNYRRFKHEHKSMEDNRSSEAKGSVT